MDERGGGEGRGALRIDRGAGGGASEDDQRERDEEEAGHGALRLATGMDWSGRRERVCEWEGWLGVNSDVCAYAPRRGAGR